MSTQFFEKSRRIYLASCLYDCIEDNNIKALEVLLSEKCADPNVLLPERGISPFHLAVGIDSEENAQEIVKLFLRHDGNPNVRSEDKLTPVHVAAAWGRISVLQILLRCGGDPTLRDDDYRTAFDYAHEEGHLDILSYLRKFRDEMIPENETESDKCHLTLDKVIINAGAIVAEYGVNNTDNPDNSLTYNLCNALQPLPKSIVNSYVENWCIKHAELIDDSHPPISYSRQSSHDAKSDSLLTDECISTSSQHKESNQMSPAFITGKSSNKKHAYVSLDSDHSEADGEEDDVDKIPRKSAKQFDYYSKTLDRRLIIDVQSESDQSEKEIAELSDDSIHVKDSSKESGILTISSGSLSNSSPENLNNCRYIKSSSVDTLDSKQNSDYVTCDESMFNKNVFEMPSMMTSDDSQINDAVIEITSDISNVQNATIICSNSTLSPDSKSASENETFYSIAEEYKYVDDSEGIVLIERRLLVNPKIDDKNSTPSKVSSLPTTIEYDTDTLRRELTNRGEEPGPITKTTKRVYLKRLMRIKQSPEEYVVPATRISERVYSVELAKTLRNPEWMNDLSFYKDLEQAVINQFSNPDPTKRWRGGVSKTSFTYLLLDPRVTNNLPTRSENLSNEECWKTFLSSIFYVGKGKRCRPYSHLYEAVTHWNKRSEKPPKKKIQKILDIWQDAHGVVCLHVFQNVIPAEAYTREAAMLAALSLQCLENAKSGEFYGIASTWSERPKRQLGVYLLYRAMLIFLSEGERQLRPNDID